MTTTQWLWLHAQDQARKKFRHESGGAHKVSLQVKGLLRGKPHLQGYDRLLSTPVDDPTPLYRLKLSRLHGLGKK